MKKVLVTGVSGFLGGHIALQLLVKGYRVEGTVRNADKAQQIRQALVTAKADLSRFQTRELDLLRDEGWREAVEGCDYVIHTASPFLLTMPKDARELIDPAVGGTRRVLQAALAAGVERIVLTSSLTAIDGGHRDYNNVLSEKDWTNLNGPNVNFYTTSKTLAEQEAWTIVRNAKATDRLVVINPATMLGPLLDDDAGTSAMIILRMLKGQMPLAPPLMLDFIDVRDVAEAHITALITPAAYGKRHILANGSLSLLDVAEILRTSLPSRSKVLPQREMWLWFAKIFALLDKSLRASASYLAVRRRIDTRHGQRLIAHPLRPIADSILDTAQSMIEKQLA